MATLAEAIITPAARIDAKPVLQRRLDGIWPRAEGIRDEIHAALETVCSEQGVDALVIKSNPAVHPAWVKFESWVRQEDPMVTARTAVIITVNPKPFCHFEFVYEVEIDNKGKKKDLPQPNTLRYQTCPIDHLASAWPRPEAGIVRASPS
jgi:hypothetical protein